MEQDITRLKRFLETNSSYSIVSELGKYPIVRYYERWEHFHSRAGFRVKDYEYVEELVYYVLTRPDDDCRVDEEELLALLAASRVAGMDGVMILHKNRIRIVNEAS